MKQLLIYLLGIILLASCEKQEIRLDNLVDVRFIAGSTIVADGSDAIRVRLFFNREAVISKIDAKAKISNGKFLESDSDELKITPVRDLNDAVFKDSISAEFNIQGTTVNKNHRLTITVNEFEQEFPINSIKSEPSSIDVDLSSSSAFPNFTDEVLISASIKNGDGKKVSQGAKVRFMDFLDNGEIAGGIFRDEQLTSNSESIVSVKYSPGLIDIDQFITIQVEVLDTDGNPVGISDSSQLFIKEIN